MISGNGSNEKCKIKLEIIKKKKRVRRTAFVETAFTTGDAVIY